MNCARFYFFDPVRFFADIDDLIHLNVSSSQQAYCLFATRLSLSIGALRPRMKFIFTQNIAVRLDSCCEPSAVKALGGNLIVLSGVLIDPGHLSPAARIQFIGRNQMKSFRVDPRWVPELLHMTRQQEVERFESVPILFSEIELCQRTHHLGAGDRHTPDSRQMFKAERLCG